MWPGCCALRIGRVDLYGDSYGNWFSQVFASRYPGMLRSVAAGSTYQVLGLDPWSPTGHHRPACLRRRRRVGRVRLGRRGARLGQDRRPGRAARPRPGQRETTTADGTRGHLTVTVETLVNLVNNAGFDPVVYRDLGAAARAAPASRAAPLLRISALSLGFDDATTRCPSSATACISPSAAPITCSSSAVARSSRCAAQSPRPANQRWCGHCGCPVGPDLGNRHRRGGHRRDPPVLEGRHGLRGRG